MSNLKEQTDEFKLVRILNKYFDDCLLEYLSECANEIIQAGYYPIQADNKGLAENPYKPSPINNFNVGIQMLHDGFDEGRKAQKALCDKEYRDKIREYIANFKATDNTAIDNILEVCARYEMLLKWIEEVELPKAKREKEEAVNKVKLHLYKIRDFLCPEIKTKKYAIDSINELLEELK
jgi:hypothetical protein